VRFGDLLAFGLPGGSEWIVILIVILVLFGGTKIPQLMRGVGKGMGELQKGLEEGKRAFQDASNEVRMDRTDEPVTEVARADTPPETTPAEPRSPVSGTVSRDQPS
jgi:sec-independent protein translocase protein TatA